MSNLENILEQTTKIASFRSRYGDYRDVYKCNIEANTYFVIGKSRYYRAGTNPDTHILEYVDFEGGPFIAVNDEFLHNKGKLPKIETLEIVKLNTDHHFCVKFKTH
jgi:hypothetical protein